MPHAAPSARPTLCDRVYDASPLSAYWLALATLVVASAALLLWVSFTGQLATFRAGDVPLLVQRDARLAVLVLALAAYAPLARRMATRGGRRNFDLLRPVLGERVSAAVDAGVGIDRFEPRRVVRAGLIGLLLVPCIALAVDRDPSLYLQGWYWGGVQSANWALGLFITWHLAILVYTVIAQARRFSALGREAEGVDLFDLDALAPFARQAMLAALPIVVFLTLFAPNLVDRGFRGVSVALLLTGLGIAVTAVLFSLRGVHQRILAIKREERARVDAAIQGEPPALGASAIAKRAGQVGLADLLAYRSFVDSRPEWPFDTGARLRFALYLAVPLGSWLGGALVERLLDAAVAAG